MAEAPLAPRSSRGSLALLGVFALGIVSGAALVVMAGHLQQLHGPHGHHGPPDDGMPPHVEKLIHDFGLDPDQEKQVRAILARSHDQIHEILGNAHKEIRALLRPDQQKKLDRMHLPHGDPGEDEPPPR